MTALSRLGQRQQGLLQALLSHRAGMTVDELGRELDISRNAVNQHLASLEGNGFVENLSLSSTGGRPSKIYTLTESGLELFPRHYALIADLLMGWVKLKLGGEELKSCMTSLGSKLAEQFSGRIQKQQGFENQVNEVAVVMHELGYASSVAKSSSKDAEIVASNCVFHQLAKDDQCICELDLSLIAGLLDSSIEHKECMARGEQCCRFAVRKK